METAFGKMGVSRPTMAWHWAWHETLFYPHFRVFLASFPQVHTRLDALLSTQYNPPYVART